MMFDLLDRRPGRRKSPFATSLLVHVMGACLVVFGVQYTGLDKKILKHITLVAPPLEAYKPEPVRQRTPPPPRPPKLQPPPRIDFPKLPEIQMVERVPQPVAPAPVAPVVKTNVFTAPVQAETPRQI